MKIVSIEPTPSPNSMKINVDEELSFGQTENYKKEDNLKEASPYIKSLFRIEGVKGIYRVMDFIALERNPKFSWEAILPEVRKVIGSKEEDNEQENPDIQVTEEPNDSFGEVKVWIQIFRGIPMQIKLNDGQEHRVGLPDRFMQAIMKASPASDNVVLERKWVEQNPRYGDVEEIGTEMVEELTASYDEKRLEDLVKQAFNKDTNTLKREEKQKLNQAILDNPDWKVRYAALDRMNPSLEDLPFLEKAVTDEKTSIRRLAVAYLGMLEDKKVLPALYKALKDKSVTVRRTAGDCISDLGFKEAIPEMVESLSDSNKLVRWRAAMYLYEIGDEQAIHALKKAVHDPEFEVRMQAKMALQRIEGGEEAKGSVWHQMTQARKG